MLWCKSSLAMTPILKIKKSFNFDDIYARIFKFLIWVFSKGLIFFSLVVNWSLSYRIEVFFFPSFNSIFWGVWIIDIQVRFSTPYCHKPDFVELWELPIWIKWNMGLEFGFGIWVFLLWWIKSIFEYSP